MGDKQVPWYGEWFDSPYYHLLYRHRDEQEAHALIDRLFEIIKPPARASILDLACGRGRHAIYCHSKGCEVTGTDLSASSIEYASTHSGKRLHFICCDMRHIVRKAHFDLILNLFTSFGYFEKDDEQIDVLKAVSSQLKSDGTFVLDYLNTKHALETMVWAESMNLEGIDFEITRKYSDDCFVKNIRIHDAGTKLEFEERVRAYRQSDFERMFSLAGLKITGVFGDYDMGTYAASSSPRLVLLAGKS